MKWIKLNEKWVADDGIVSREMLEDSVSEILNHVTLNREYDIPYLAGYSKDLKTIYIDRHLPKTFTDKGGTLHHIDKFLILHESVEKSLLDSLHLIYQHAHQIALRIEQAAVWSSSIDWEEYNKFMSIYIKKVGNEKLTKVPKDLDLTPYQDEGDQKLIDVMKKNME